MCDYSHIAKRVDKSRAIQFSTASIVHDAIPQRYASLSAYVCVFVNSIFPYFEYRACAHNNIIIITMMAYVVCLCVRE